MYMRMYMYMYMCRYMYMCMYMYMSGTCTRNNAPLLSLLGGVGGVRKCDNREPTVAIWPKPYCNLRVGVRFPKCVAFGGVQPNRRDPPLA